MAKFSKKEPKEVKEPEVIADGVVREVGENPIQDNPMEKKPRASGNWKKVTQEELMSIELAGNLVGYDPSTQEALVK